MKQHNVIQGTQEWHDLRDKHFSASEAAAVMGDHKYMSRDELLHIYATGEKPEVTPQQQKLFDKGHAAEEAARPIAEAIIGEELFPVTATDDNDWLLASMDGLTMLGDIGWEHKLYSKALAAQVVAGDLDMHYIWQLEHQALVTGCEQILFTTSDGTEANKEEMYYKPDPKLQKKLIAGWKQFEKDLAEYKTKLKDGIEQPAEATAEVIKDLPAITYQMNGLALTSNLKAFELQAQVLIEKSREPLVDDDDFATAEKLVKVFKTAEDKLDGLAEQVLGEVQDIDQFTKDLKFLKEQIRKARLDSDKQVKAEKERRKNEIITKADEALTAYISDRQADLEVLLPNYRADFAGAMKGKKTIASLQSAANDTLAAAKIDIDQMVDEIKTNMAILHELGGGDYRFLFADLEQIVTKPSDDFTALVKSRIADHKEAEQQKLEAERERIRQEEAQDAEQASGNKQLADDFAGEVVESVTTGKGVITPKTDKKLSRPSHQEIIDVLAAHFDVPNSTVRQWLSEWEIAA